VWEVLCRKQMETWETRSLNSIRFLEESLRHFILRELTVLRSDRARQVHIERVNTNNRKLRVDSCRTYSKGIIARKPWFNVVSRKL